MLALWISALNNRFGSDTIKLNNTAVSITLHDAWLSGFTDAEGCFNVSITDVKHLIWYIFRSCY